MNKEVTEHEESMWNCAKVVLPAPGMEVLMLLDDDEIVVGSLVVGRMDGSVWRPACGCPDITNVNGWRRMPELPEPVSRQWLKILWTGFYPHCFLP